MNQSTAAFLGLSSTPVGAIGRTMFVIQHSDTKEYVRVTKPGFFTWYKQPLKEAARFPTADEAWAAIALRNKTQGPGAGRPFVIAPVTVTETPGKEITETVPALTAFVLQALDNTAWTNKGLYVAGYSVDYSASYTCDIAKAKEFSAAEAGEWIANRVNTYWGQKLGNTFALVPVTVPASTRVVGREPSTVTVELA